MSSRGSGPVMSEGSLRPLSGLCEKAPGLRRVDAGDRAPSPTLAFGRR
jgi:hypothetical protein